VLHGVLEIALRNRVLPENTVPDNVLEIGVLHGVLENT
jgi:hypothetical protein